MSVVESSARARRLARRGPRTRLELFPRRRARRWMLRLAFALPYLAIAFVTGGSAAGAALDTPNARLLDRLATIPWDRADPEWIGLIYPPLSTVVAALIPGGRLGLAVVGALIAGVFLQKLVEIMVQRRFPTSTTVILTVALGLNPLFAYTVLENFAGFLGLAFFGLAIADVARFVLWRNTRAGFRAGILLMLAALSDLSGLVYVLAAVLAAPFLRQARAHQPGARAANVLVVGYPTVAALAAMFALNAIFNQRLVNAAGLDVFAGTAERAASLGPLFTTPAGWLLVAPVLSAWLIALIVRRPGTILAATLVFVAVLGGYVVGLIPPGSAGNTFILMTVLAIALLPTAKSRVASVLVDVVAVLQIVIAWAAAFDRDIVAAWMAALLGALGIPTG